MGRYTDGLTHRIRARRNAKHIRHPKNYDGMVMWCSLCRGEMYRSPATRHVSQAAQQAAYDRHMLTCPMRHLPRPDTRRRIERGARVILRRQWLHRWRWRLVALAIIAAAVTWLALK